MSDYEPDSQNLQNLDDSGHTVTTEDLAVADSDDTPGPGLDIAGQIHLQLCAISDKMDQARCDAAAKEQWRLNSLPNVLTLPTQVVTLAATAGNPVLVDFGTPQQGRQWDLRSVVVAPEGADLTAAAGGTCDVSWYVGPLPNVPLTNTVSSLLRWPMNLGASGEIANGFPAADKIGPQQIPIRAGERLFAIVTTVGATSVGKRVYVTPTIADEPTKSARPVMLQ